MIKPALSAVASREESGDQATANTQFSCPFKVTNGISVLHSQMITVQSPEQLAKNTLLGENAMSRIACVCPSKDELMCVTGFTWNSVSGT